MEEQLKVLSEMVQQLQADNQQLREELFRRPANAGGEAQAVSPRRDVDARSFVNISASERYVYVPRERKCPRFSGKRSIDLLTVEDWVEEVRRSLIVRPVPVAEKALFVYDLLDGEAKAEVKFRPASDRDDPEKIFTILLDMYGCSQSLVGLQKQFFQRRQLEGETLREYSHALMALMEAMKRKNLPGICNPDHTLRDQFIEHMRDNTLRRELRRQVRLNPEMSFLEVRSEAIRWADEGEAPGVRPRAHSCAADVQVVGTYRSNSHSPEFTNELGELKDCLRKQQVQLDAILKHLSISPSNTVGVAVGSRPGAARFQADGKPICLRCNKAGHIARFCRSDLAGMQVNLREGAGTGRGQLTQVQSQTVAQDTPVQSGN